MESHPLQRLREEIRAGSELAIHDLAAAETAVLAGQFNLAKVLRAAAHSRRVTALNAARALVGEPEFPSLLAQGADSLDSSPQREEPRVIPQSKRISEPLRRSTQRAD